MRQTDIQADATCERQREWKKEIKERKKKKEERQLQNIPPLNISLAMNK